MLLLVGLEGYLACKKLKHVLLVGFAKLA